MKTIQEKKELDTLTLNLPPSLEQDKKVTIICSFCLSVPIIKITPKTVYIKCEFCKYNIEEPLEVYYSKLSHMNISNQPCEKDQCQNNSVSYCLNCNKWFCISCLGIHYNLCPGHRLLDPKAFKFFCFPHNKDLKFYCKNCKEQLCQKCKYDHKHHKITPLSEIISKEKMDEYKENLRKAKLKQEKQAEILQTFYLGALENERNRILSAFKKNSELNNLIYQTLTLLYQCYDSGNYNYNLLNSITNNINFKYEQFIKNPNVEFLSQENLNALISFLEENTFIDDTEEFKEKENEKDNEIEKESENENELEKENKNKNNNEIEKGNENIQENNFNIFDENKEQNAIKSNGFVINDKEKIIIQNDPNGYEIEKSHEPITKRYKFENFTQWKEITNVHDLSITSILLLQDKRLASCSGDKHIIIYDPEKDYNIDIDIDDNERWIQNIIQLHNGNLVSCSFNGKLKFWEIKKHLYKCLYNIQAHSDAIIKLINLPSQRFASCSDDATIKIWDSNTSDIISEFTHKKGKVHSFIHLNDTNNLLSVTTENELYLWNINSGKYSIAREEILCCKRNAMVQIDKSRVLIGGHHQMIVFNAKKENIEEILREVWTEDIEISSLLVLKDNMLLCGYHKGIAYIDLSNFTCVCKKDDCHDKYINSIISIDEDTFASCSELKIILWK